METVKPLSLDDEEILQFTLDGHFHIWPLVRFDLLTALSRGNAPKPLRRQISKGALVLNLLKGLSGIKFKRCSIQFVSSTLFCVKQTRGYRNILEDYFCRVYPKDSFVYENLDPLNYSRRLPRENSRVSTAFTYVDLIAKSIGRFSTAHATKDVEDFCQHLAGRGITPEHVDVIRGKLTRYARQLKIQQFLYRFFLNLCCPRILFVNCGSYGAANAILIHEAKKLGILTAEIQHGVIDTLHYAYNYSDYMKESGVYKNYMPDYLLTFGEYWHSCMNNSCAKTSVGHPHLSMIREQFDDRSCPGSFLVISQWTITDEMIGAAVKIRQAYPQANIKYRLHPVERLTDSQRQLLATSRIDIADGVSDIYAEFQFFEYIVGCYSTALYEAKAFGKKVFIVEHPLAMQYGFDRVGSVFDDPITILQCSRSDNHGVESRFFYEDEFDKKYRSFVESV